MAICPNCDTSFDRKAPERKHLPFCSERCKLLDLSKWLDGDYRIPGPPVPTQHRSPYDPYDA